MPFRVFSHNRFPEWVQNVIISSHWELPADAVSPPSGIFSNPVLNDPIVIWTHFRMLAHQGSWKKPARTHSKPLWRHILEKQLSKTHLGAKITENRHRLTSKWTTWPRPQFTHLSLGAPLCDTWAPNLKKQSPGIQIYEKFTNITPHMQAKL